MNFIEVVIGELQNRGKIYFGEQYGKKISTTQNDILHLLKTAILFNTSSNLPMLLVSFYALYVNVLPMKNRSLSIVYKKGKTCKF